MSDLAAMTARSEEIARMDNGTGHLDAVREMAVALRIPNAAPSQNYYYLLNEVLVAEFPDLFGYCSDCDERVVLSIHLTSVHAPLVTPFFRYGRRHPQEPTGGRLGPFACPGTREPCCEGEVADGVCSTDCACYTARAPEACDECNGTRWPSEVHESHCSLSEEN